MSLPAAEGTPSSSAAAGSHRRPAFTNLWLCLALTALTTAVYAPIRHHAFLNYDDNEYVTENPHVTGGLSRESIVWAWTQAHSATWHPLTTLTHLLDCELFGLDPGPPHVVNGALHVVSTLLLFGVLVRMTGQAWRSACTAALFGVHPIHIESVAWVAERKDVLSTCFWMLTLWSYVAYADRPGGRRYGLVVVAYVAALLSKPMVVTLPFVLLLLDLWPLGRVRSRGAGGRGAGAVPVLPCPPAPLLPPSATLPAFCCWRSCRCWLSRARPVRSPSSPSSTPAPWSVCSARPLPTASAMHWCPTSPTY